MNNIQLSTIKALRAEAIQSLHILDKIQDFNWTALRYRLKDKVNMYDYLVLILPVIKISRYAGVGRGIV
jgi:hypothetical protein